MEELLSPPEEKKLPPPEEKLLRTPTFMEKYAKFPGLIVLLFLIIILTAAVMSVNKTPKLSQSPQPLAPTQSLPTSNSTPTADPTANWKTYTNTLYGYTFQYPQTMKVRDSTDTDGLYENGVGILETIVDPLKHVGGGYPQPLVLVWVYKNDAASLDAWVTKHTASSDPSGSTLANGILYWGVRNKTATTLVNQPAIIFHGLRGEGGNFDVTVTIHGNNIVGIVKNLSYTNNETSLILSTFKFLDQTTSQIIPLSTVWQMGKTPYTDPRLSISFEYPKGFTVKAVGSSSFPPDSKITFGMSIMNPEGTIEIAMNQWDNSSNQTSSALDALVAGEFAGQDIITSVSSVPVPGSYVIIHNPKANASKNYYFMNKAKIYRFSLYVRHNLGDNYSADEERVLDQIVSSIKFTQ